MLTTLLTLAAAAATPAPATPAADLAAIEATCFDYVDGQLEGDPERVKRALHPDLAKRRVLGDTPDERLGLQRMSREELVDLTKRGALKTPKAEWDRACRILDVAGDAAAVRVETPWFVDYFHMGKFGERWVIVNAMWHMKRGGTPAATPATETAAAPLFALALAPGRAWKPGRPFSEQGLRPHFDYWMALFREGRIATAGPVGTDSGLVLLRAPDQAAAEAILAADPAIAAGIFTGTVRPYAPPMVNGAALPRPRAATK